MAFNRTTEQIDWEEKYVSKVELFKQIEPVFTARMNRLRALFDGSLASSLPNSVSAANVSPSDIDYPSVGSLDGVAPDNLQVAQIVGGLVQPPSAKNRTEYNKARLEYANSTKKAGFITMDTDMFYFDTRIGGKEQNQFSPEFAQILYMLHPKIKHLWKNGKVYVNSGYRKNPASDSQGRTVEYSAHRWGGAVDIGCFKDDRYVVADAAWNLGLRAVFVGRTFVHIDCGPPAFYSYEDIPTYKGPSSH